MEGLAYTHCYAAYEEATGIEYDFPEWERNWTLPSSAWLGLLGVVFLFSSMNATTPASATQYYVRTNGSCLNARYRPSLNSSVHTCVRNGTALAPVVSFRNGFAKLSTGRYVSAAYISSSPGRVAARRSSSRVARRIRSARSRYVIGLGSKGSVVSTVQRALDRQGYDLLIDGKYGHETYGAVRRFQINNGLLADGKVGPQTRSALFS
ncbi:MAG TPA: peptidoglycan-binding domain-containing protein [Allocoleopsis sp.]